VSVSLDVNNPLDSKKHPRSPAAGKRARIGFVDDFKRFFLGGLQALLPTLITISVVWWIWDLLWDHLGQHLMAALRLTWAWLAEENLVTFQPRDYIGFYWSDDKIQTRLVGVLLSFLTVYIVGLIAGNLIGRTFWKLGERMVMKIPVIRAIYPAVKQVTDFVLAERKEHFQSNHVVAVQPHSAGIWSIGLVTGSGLKPLTDRVGEEMITVFVPSSPTAFSGYVLVVPRSGVVELPMTVEEAMRLLVSGGVIEPNAILNANPAQQDRVALVPSSLPAAEHQMQKAKA
jgi:uncharacterized membrane protein